MSLISEGIDQVRAFAIPAGIGNDGTSPNSAGAALIRWKSSHSDKLYQIYVNGKLAQSTIDTCQREVLLRVPFCIDIATRIEVYATEQANANNDQSYLLPPASIRQGRMQIEFPINDNLPDKGQVNYYFDNGSGVIDYETPLNERSVSLWPKWQWC